MENGSRRPCGQTRTRFIRLQLERILVVKTVPKGGTGGRSFQASPTVNLPLSFPRIWTPTRDHIEDSTLSPATGSSFPRIVRSDHGKANKRPEAAQLGHPTIQSVTCVREMIGPAAQKTLRTRRPLYSGMIMLPFFPTEFQLHRVMACCAAKALREIVESSVSLHGTI